MKKLTLLVTLLVFGLTVKAQSPIGEGGSQLNMGVGLADGYLPLYVGFDYGVHPDITVGGQANFDLGLDYLGLAGRGDYHFNTLMDIPQDWDFYGGASLGFIAGLDTRRDDLDLDLGLQIGGRYYWDETWAINLEFSGGYFYSGGRLGVSMKL